MNKSSENSTAAEGLQYNVTQATVPDGRKCLLLQFNGYVPWDNPDNLLSAQTEFLIDRLKGVVFLPLLFLIGGPGNVINMAVYWRLGVRERINLCLFALSLADELYLVQSLFINGERMYTQFTTKERYGPFTKWMANHYLVGFFGFTWISQVISAIIASERCFCVVSPLRSQVLLTTRTMAIIIVIVFAVVLGLYFVVASRYFIDCVVDPVSGLSFNSVIGGQFYYQNKEFILYLDYFVYGLGLPGFSIVVVFITTTITTVQLRRKLAWRQECSSYTLSRKEVALTKTLIAASALFIVCVFPIFMYRFLLLFFPEMNAGRRHHNAFFAALWLLEIFSFVNSSFNVVIYYTMGSRFRKTLKKMMGRGKKPAKNRPQVTETTTLSRVSFTESSNPQDATTVGSS